MKTVDKTLGDLAREVPGATSVFYRHRLDFCCGGQQTLAQAVEGKGLDAHIIAEGLAQLPRESGATDDWNAALDADLIEHILTRYHDTLRQQLPELIRLSRRVELVHGGHPECPAGLSSHLENNILFERIDGRGVEAHG